MGELRELQRLMASVVMRPLSAGGNLRARWKDGRSTRVVAAEFIKPNERLTSFARLQIYSRQYWFRVRDCFYEDYPGLHAVLGNAKFQRLAVAYLANHPSGSFSLRNLGRHLAEFIAAEPKWTAPRTPISLDMARLEWAHTEAFDNEARQSLTAGEILDDGPQKLKLRIQPHVTLLKMDHALDDFLIASRRNLGLRSEASNAVGRKHTMGAHCKMVRPLRRETWLAVHRHQNRVYYKRLSQAQFELLAAVDTTGSLARAMGRFAKEFGGAIPRADAVGRWFREWAALGWFTR